MGYAVEFYGLDWSSLEGLIGSKNEAAMRDVETASRDSIYGSPYEELDWRGALRELVLGRRGQLLADRGIDSVGSFREESSPEEALSMVMIVRAGGTRLGDVFHTSRGGTAFRSLLDGVRNPFSLREPALLPFLLQRPFFGIFRSDYPMWGGLRKLELGQLLGDQTMENLRGVDDSDDGVWYYRLFSVLSDARDYGKDLVTLYL